MMFRRVLKVLPKFKDEQLRRNAKYIDSIDPQIASLVSVSLVGKCRMQHGLNYNLAKKSFFQNYSGSSEQDDFLKTHKLDWF